MDLVLKNLQWLICHKTEPNKYIRFCRIICLFKEILNQYIFYFFILLMTTKNFIIELKFIKIRVRIHTLVCGRSSHIKQTNKKIAPTNTPPKKTTAPKTNKQKPKTNVENLYKRCIVINHYKLATLLEGDPKAPFSIATTPRCRGGRYSFPLIAPLYP